MHGIPGPQPSSRIDAFGLCLRWVNSLERLLVTEMGMPREVCQFVYLGAHVS